MNATFSGAVLALLTFLATTATTAALAQSTPLTYAQVVTEARRIEGLEGSEHVISKDLLFKRVRLDLHSYSAGSDAMYVTKRDEISFVCSPAQSKFVGGWVDAQIDKHAPGAEGSHFFTLSDCQPVE
ncbi:MULTISPECIES: hypothetical protein [unclassified Variovorax]|uniref:hypothetical protein n=1 Tax=unclassified Variovorax TaxID=663243 RepID=UPI002578F3C0|nr:MULTISPECIES: hypothetical protein [unclassified Variovorax]MDM0091656.1 hypothetical protein [Variovorax sp. J22G40]MDM0146013.1 hypothetical protein [Variovorax sp. J2P1-31]